MYFGFWLAIFGLAVASTAVWGVAQRQIPFSASVAAATWMLLAIVSDTVSIYPQGSEIVVGEPAIQYLFAGLGLLSAGAIILWWFGQYPAEEELEVDGSEGVLKVR
jgi:hypothetical protein